MHINTLNKRGIMQPDARVLEGFDYYFITKEGEVFYEDEETTRKLKEEENGTVYLKDFEGEHRRAVVRKLVANTFIGVKPQGCKLVSLDGNVRNNKLNNLVYKPKMSRKVYQSGERYVASLVYRGESVYFGNYHTSRQARERVEHIINLINAWMDWHNEPFLDDIRYFRGMVEGEI